MISNPKLPVTKLYGLDHLRTLAIALIFLFHFGRLFPHPEWTNTISKFGWNGVDLFFVLSGYLIASQLFLRIAQDKGISVKSFFLKRFFRIIPAYLVVVTIYFCFPYVHERESLAPLWKYLTFTQNLGLDLRTQGTFSHAWSLCIEEQFYLIFPLVLLFLVNFKLFKNAAWLLIFLFVFGIAIRYYSYQTFILPNINSDEVWAFWYENIYYPTYCRLDGLLIGISIAALFEFRKSIKDKVKKYGNWLLLLSIVILVAAYFLCMNEQSFQASVFGFPLVSIGYGFMVLSAISPTSILYKLKSNTTTYIASLSYSIYLIHKFIIHITQAVFSSSYIEKESNLMFLICILTTLISAILLNNIIEKPFLRIRDKLNL